MKCMWCGTDPVETLHPLAINDSGVTVLACRECCGLVKGLEDDQCKHGMHSDDCSICKHPQTARVATTYEGVGSTFEAKYAGTCVWCQEWFGVGELIIRSTGAGYGHEDCCP